MSHSDRYALIDPDHKKPRQFDRAQFDLDHAWMSPSERRDWLRIELAWFNTRPPIPTSVRRAVLERDGHACVTCGRTDRLAMDHIVPYLYGGPDVESNLQTLCISCNSRKGANR